MTINFKRSITKGVFFARNLVSRRACSVLLLSSVLCSAQYGCITILPSASAATETTWNSYYDQGMDAFSRQSLAQAEQLFRQALSLAEHQSKNPTDIEQCMLKLADTLTLRDKTSEAQRLYSTLLDILIKRYGKNSPQIAPVLLALGSIQESEGDHSNAMDYYQRALQINEKHYGPYSPAVASSLHRIGRVDCKAGNRSQAKLHYRRALSILSQQPELTASGQLENLIRDYGDLLKGDDNSNKDLIRDFNEDIGVRAVSHPIETSTPHPELPPQSSSNAGAPVPTGSAATAAGSAWQQQSRFQLNASRQSQSDEDPQVVLRGMEKPESTASLSPAYKVLNDSLFKQNRYEKGESYYQRMIAVDTNALGPNHPSLANDLTGLAQLYIARQRYAEAEPLLIRALPIYEKTYGADTLLTINTRATLASVEFHLGKVEQAAELYRTALNSGQSALGPNSLETARILNDLAYLYFHQGKLQEACTFYEWALASTEGAVGQRDPLVAACLKDYAQVLRSLGKTSEATAIEERAEKIVANAK